MPQCRIHIEQPLPPVCLCCDANASHYSKQTFINTNPWTLWTVPLGTWYYNKVILQIPLCNTHRNTIRYRWIVPFLFLVLGGLGIFALWGAYSSIYGREASDAVSGWIGGAVAVVFVIFYAALLYVSFTKPHVTRVQGGYITLSKVSERFAAAARDKDATVMVAEFADDPPAALYADSTNSAPIKLPNARAALPLILLPSLGLVAMIACAVGFGLVISVNLSQPVKIRAERLPSPMLLNGALQLRVTYTALGTLDDRDQYAWVIKHGEQTLTPRFMSAWELRQGGAVEFHLFDPNATTAEIWLESRSSNGAAARKTSNVVQVKTS